MKRSTSARSRSSPARAASRPSSVLALTRHRIVSGRQTVTLTLDRAPAVGRCRPVQQAHRPQLRRQPEGGERAAVMHTWRSALAPSRCGAARLLLGAMLACLVAGVHEPAGVRGCRLRAAARWPASRRAQRSPSSAARCSTSRRCRHRARWRARAATIRGTRTDRPTRLSVQLAGRDGRTPGLRAAPALRYLQHVARIHRAPLRQRRRRQHRRRPDRRPHLGWARRLGARTGAAAAAVGRTRWPTPTPAEAVAAAAARARWPRAFARRSAPRCSTTTTPAFRVARCWRSKCSSSRRATSIRTAAATTRCCAAAADADASGGARAARCSTIRPRATARRATSSAPTADGAFPLFTDFGLIAIGVPRHRGLPANTDPGFFDLGLCGPLRSDLRDRAEYCGRFRTPGLRNVALRGSFFHNGVLHIAARCAALLRAARHAAAGVLSARGRRRRRQVRRPAGALSRQRQRRAAVRSPAAATPPRSTTARSPT